VLGKSFFELFLPPDLHGELKNVYAAMLANLPRSRHHENTLLTRCGEHRLIRWNNSVLRSIQGEVIGIASIGEDITERQRSDIHIKRLSRVYAVLSEINALSVRVRDRQELSMRRAALQSMLARSKWRGSVSSTQARWRARSSPGTAERRTSYVQIKLTARDENTPDSRGQLVERCGNRNP